MTRPLGERERIIERRRWVMIEKRKGKSLDDIHRQWNDENPDLECSRSTIAADIRETLKKSVEETSLATLEWRQLHIERIERVLSGTIFQNKLDAGDLFTIDRFDKLMDKLIKLTGAYAPTKIAATDVTGEKDASGLTDEERADRIRELLARADSRKQMAEAEAALAEE
jgi:hypothetical protein